MNIDKIINVVRKVTADKYPDKPEIADFCEKIIRYERDNTSYTMPRYKEPYRRYLSECICIDDDSA